MSSMSSLWYVCERVCVMISENVSALEWEDL